MKLPDDKNDDQEKVALKGQDVEEFPIFGVGNVKSPNETITSFGFLKSLTSLNGSILNTQPLGLRPKAVFRQVLMVVLANMSVLSAGMSLGYPAVTLNQLTDQSNPNYLNEQQASWFASVNTIACPVGALLSGYLLDKVGRKRTILTINLTAIVSWGLMTLTPESPNFRFIIIMISRVIIGITTGLASSPVGVYSAEVCHPNLRGRLTLGTSISTASGILFIYTLGYFIQDNFRLISGIACVYSVVATIVLIPIPESPSWLLTKSRIEEAEKSLRYFRGLPKNDTSSNPEFDTEMQQLLKSIPSTKSQKRESLRKMLLRPEVYKPLLIMIAFFGFQQFSGIFVVIVYAVKFATDAGTTLDPLICAILVGFTRLVTTFFAGYVLDKWGRRPPAMISGFGMAICMFILAFGNWYPKSMDVPYLPVACIVIYILTSTLGLMTLPFSMISEVFPQNARATAAGLAVCFGYLMSFVTIKTYPGIVSDINQGFAFAMYGTVSALAIVFVYFFLPETNGRTLYEIEEYFKNSKNNKGRILKEIEMRNVLVK